MHIDGTEEHWYAGMTLLERHQALTDVHGLRSEEGTARELRGEPVDEAADGAADGGVGGSSPRTGATDREARWRHSGPFAGAGSFERRLAADGLTRERFRRLVAGAPSDVRRIASVPPAWLRDLVTEWRAGHDLEMPPLEIREIGSARGTAGGSGAAELSETAPDSAWEDLTNEVTDDVTDDGVDDGAGDRAAARMLGLLRVVRPLVAGAFARFRDGLEALLARHPDGPVSREAGERVFLTGLAQQVIALVGRTLVLELNVARLSGLLEGETGDARFRSFVDALDSVDRGLDSTIDCLEGASMQAALLREYPLLARVVMTMLGARVEGRLECLRHVCEDWGAIVARWPGLAAGRLVAVSPALGDPHRGGRAVLGVRFERGGHLVYKPRSLAVDVHFQELLAWLNARGATPAFRTIGVLDRVDHGWVEAMSGTPCETREAVTRFYERLGGVLAVLYALEATDIHYENLVACGEDPVLVDLESLFHPRAEQRRQEADRGETAGRTDADPEPTATRLAAEALHDSVLRVGLLPQRVWSRAEFAGIDLSACGGEPGQRLPQAVPVWEAAGTDTMRLAERAGTLPPSANRPTLGGEPVDVLEDAAALERGFARTYRLLCDFRARLLEERGPIRRFAADRMRAILRPTRLYGLLLQESTHPDVLRDGLDRDRLFDWLWAEVERQPSLARVIFAERHDLERGDVPCFTTSPSSRSIWTSTGVEIGDYYTCSGLERVEDRLGRMGETDLVRQRWFLRAALTSLAPAEGRSGSPGGVPLAPPAAPEAFVDAAARVAHRLGALAFVDGTRASWVGLTLLAEERWSLVPLGLDLYGGLPGIALFLARLASVTGDARHRRLASHVVTSVLEQIEPQRAWPLIGAFSGWGGVVYALAHLGVLLNDDRCLVSAEALVPRLRECVPGDRALDVVAGAAGAIMGLAALQVVRPADGILATIDVCAAHLVARAEDQPVGCGWRTALPSSAPLLGLSHGTGGMALALFTAAALTDGERVRETARRAIAYERGAFFLPAKNWPDFRLVDVADVRGSAGSVLSSLPSSPPGGRRFMTTWCHGAPGVGLARLAGLRYMDDWRTRVELAEAVQTTLRDGFGLSHCLCHGDLGNLEFLAVAAARLGDTALRRDVAQMAAGLLRSMDERGWRCGVPLQVETPGFMMGLAGIGDGLLRIADPGLPSVLMLEPPAATHEGVRGRPAVGPCGGAWQVESGGDAEAPPEAPPDGGARAPVAVRRR